jgi:hypothetical protein
VKTGFPSLFRIRKLFATFNEINGLSKPLDSRFRKLFLPRYTEKKLLDVSEKVLPKLSSRLID